MNSNVIVMYFRYIEKLFHIWIIFSYKTNGVLKLEHFVWVCVKYDKPNIYGTYGGKN